MARMSTLLNCTEYFKTSIWRCKEKFLKLLFLCCVEYWICVQSQRTRAIFTYIQSCQLENSKDTLLANTKGNSKIKKRKDLTIRSSSSLTIKGLGCQRWILTRRDRGSRCRREERPGRAQSVVFVLEFLRFTDVRSGKAFEIWNECAQTFISQAARTITRGEDAWSCAYRARTTTAWRGKCVFLCVCVCYVCQAWLIIISPPSGLRTVGVSFLLRYLTGWIWSHVGTLRTGTKMCRLVIH